MLILQAIGLITISIAAPGYDTGCSSAVAQPTTTALPQPTTTALAQLESPAVSSKLPASTNAAYAQLNAYSQAQASDEQPCEESPNSDSAAESERAQEYPEKSEAHAELSQEVSYTGSAPDAESDDCTESDKAAKPDEHANSQPDSYGKNVYEQALADDEPATTSEPTAQATANNGGYGDQSLPLLSGASSTFAATFIAILLLVI